MNILVCIKQVPDTKIIKVNPKTNTLDRSSAPAILNPYDAHAVEEAVRLREIHGGKVIVLSMGPPQARNAIRKCVEIGADEGYLISDRRFAGADTLATSYALFKAIEKLQHEQGIDLVLCGKHAIDGDTGQVGPGIARRMEIPPLTNVIKVEEVDLEGGKLKVRRKIENGYELIQSSLPCLLTVEKEINEVAYSPLPNMLRAARYEPTVWTVDDLDDVDIKQLGLKGSPTIVGKMWPPEKSSGAEMIEGEAKEQVEKLLAITLEKRELFGVKGGEK
ncbi:electron transfer flavoprotein subunit beta/FixA family protein [Salipaludibacillus sp. CUR1]|uniref:Electron transfer flavoprotein small subunit n=1 Tax=Salipaludibacillus aurantiacus TaxID=1601833 RepID=A0A1H9WI77_9BACI|nr:MULTISPECIES: electron transfer flavoprotein subunit beta/FixA family protein [Salipaludibacillus]MCE7792279.1 electron transfer flavoprotein subunit beta/FixA family protein [Salipaludibacillus sp. CUR1]SES33449.1 electron transfer flavoprotein beta subunit [Salipaludibacillus aurantiacus]